MAAVERLIEGSGTCERTWLRSPWLAAMRWAQARDVVAAAPRVVVVSPHPDDEVLACGGLLAELAAAGTDIVVVSVSDGEACYPALARWTAAELRALRRDELMRALKMLGVEAELVSLSVADGGVAAAVPAVARALAAQLRPGDCILAPWRHDGHPDHEAAFAAAARAARATAAHLVEYPVWGWHWSHPDHRDIAAAAAVRVALSPRCRRAKRAAIACFATQTGRCDPPIDAPVLPAAVLARFARGFEVFFL